mgnify:CR=1 FL=1
MQSLNDDFPYEWDPTADTDRMNFPEKERWVMEMHRDSREREAIRADMQELEITRNQMMEAANSGNWGQAANFASVCEGICKKIESYIFFVDDRNHWRNEARGYQEMEKRFRKLNGEKVGFWNRLFG